MEIQKLTAVSLGKKIKEKEISVREALDAVFAQIDQTEGRYHAYVTLDKEGAYKQADAVQEKIDKGELTGALAGVPVAIKDNMCTKGLLTTCSSKILENYIPTYTASAVQNLTDAGCVIIGKTNMDEFAMGSTTETSYYGVTRNPHNPDHVPGGSSGGSAAAVALNECFFALGSDTGGSIRQPSAFCGITGMKPTYGTVSRYGLIAYGSSLDQIGPMTKNVTDCAAVLETIASYDKKDSTSMKREKYDFTSALVRDVKGLRIGLPKDYFGEGLDSEVKAAIFKAAETFRRMGAIVEEFHSMYKKTRSEGFGSEVKRRIMLGSFVLSSGYYDAYYLKALKTKALIKQEFDKAFEKYDIILAPAAPTTAPLLGSSLQDPIKMYLSDIYTISANLAGIPGLSIPCGKDKMGLPIGMQLLGGCFQEKTLLCAGFAYEKAREEEA